MLLKKLASFFRVFSIQLSVAENCVMAAQNCTRWHTHKSASQGNLNQFRESPQAAASHQVTPNHFQVAQPLLLLVHRLVRRFQEPADRAVEEVSENEQAHQTSVTFETQGLAYLAATSIVRLASLRQQRRTSHLQHHVHKCGRLKVNRILNDESALFRLQDLFERPLACGRAVAGKVRLPESLDLLQHRRDELFVCGEDEVK